MNNKISLVAGLVFMVISGFAFWWLWNQTQNPVVSTAVAENLQPIEIETVKSKADNLLFSLENKGNLPIPVPTGKMGKENPFK